MVIKDSHVSRTGQWASFVLAGGTSITGRDCRCNERVEHGDTLLTLGRHQGHITPAPPPSCPARTSPGRPKGGSTDGWRAAPHGGD